MTTGRPRAILLDPNEGCLRIARVLVRHGVPAAAIASPETAYCAPSRGVTAHVMRSAAVDDPKGWRERLRAVAGSEDCVVVAGSDQASELLLEAGLPPSIRSFEAASPGAHMTLMDKRSTYELAARSGVRAPRTTIVEDAAAVERAVAQAAYPCVVKPLLSHLGKVRGDHRTRPASDPGELRSLLRDALAAGVQMMVSEQVPGGDDLLEGAYLVRGPEGERVVQITRAKLRQHPPGYGVGSLFVTCPAPETAAIGWQLLDEAGFVGVAAIECKRHAQTGERVLIEVNVRVPAGWAIGDAAGLDASWRLYETLAGRSPSVSAPPQIDGVRAMLPQLDLPAVTGLLKRREASLREIVRSYRGTRAFGALDARDPRPALALARRTVRRRVGR